MPPWWYPCDDMSVDCRGWLDRSQPLFYFVPHDSQSRSVNVRMLFQKYLKGFDLEGTEKNCDIAAKIKLCMNCLWKGQIAIL